MACLSVVDVLTAIHARADASGTYGVRRRGAQSTGSGSREIGQHMQRGPPRPEPSSEPAIRDDLDAGLLEAGVGLVVALVGDRHPRRERQGVVAVVPLLALGGDRVEAGVDLVQRVDLHRLGGGDQERLGVGDVEHQVARRRRRARRSVTAYACRVSATLGYITILSTSTIVQTVSRCIVARSCAIGTASTVCARSAWKTWRASRSTPAGVVRSPTPTAITPGREQQHVAALDVLVVPAVDLAGAGEARVLGVDQLGQLGLALARRHRQRGDRDPVAHPDAGVAGEQQVGQRVDEEVVAGQQRW